jgi:predicted TIM-barrel fold metal-dependent hydrolase
MDILLKYFIPRSQLLVPATTISTPRFPVIDAHNHLGETFGGGWCHRPIDELLQVMDEAGVRIVVDLDGGWGETILEQRLEKYKSVIPDRFCFFGGVDFSTWSMHGKHFPEWAASRIKAQAARGVQGIKIWKGFGLHVRDHKGQLVAVDDQRLDPIWQTSAELGLPVLIHVADPVAFFDPLDHSNERWEELQAHPDWHFPNPPYQPFMTILDQLFNMVKHNSSTRFIGAHVGCYAENLAWVANMLDECPNYFIDISARIAELGRQPYTAREFFIHYQDRILFGTDFAPDIDRYRLFYRFLETTDEYFNYDLEDPPTQGRWCIYGLHLPDEVLQKIYFLNAANILNLSDTWDA